MPHLVSTDQLSSANTLSLVASFGTFPLASAIFSLLAALAAWLGGFDALARRFEVDQEVLALWSTRAPSSRRRSSCGASRSRSGASRSAESIDFVETVREIKDGLRFIAHEPRVAASSSGSASA